MTTPGGLFEHLERRVQVLENQRLDVRVTLSDLELGHVYQRLDSIGETQAAHTERLDAIETTLSAHTVRLDGIDVRLEAIEGALARIEDVLKRVVERLP